MKNCLVKNTQTDSKVVQKGKKTWELARNTASEQQWHADTSEAWLPQAQTHRPAQQQQPDALTSLPKGYCRVFGPWTLTACGSAAACDSAGSRGYS